MPNDIEYYPDGKTPKTYFRDKDGSVKMYLNQYGYSNRIQEPCRECGQWECDLEGVGHYRG
mgnify:CR=1 FL=1